MFRSLIIAYGCLILAAMALPVARPVPPVLPTEPLPPLDTIQVFRRQAFVGLRDE